MELPYGYDPITVSRITINACYYVDPADFVAAIDLLGEVFPNAEVECMMFEEDRGDCVMKLEPRPKDLSDEKFYEIYEAVENFLPQGPYRGMNFHGDDDLSDPPEPAGGWTPPDPDAWKNAD
jgi:hypothetical protein